MSFHVYELLPEQYHIAAALLATAWFDEAYIQMVLEGIQPGRIFVDDPAHPTAALLCHPYEFYVVGEVVSSLRQFIKEAPTEADIFHTLYGYCAAGDEWERAILTDRAGELHMIPRRNFKYHNASALEWKSVIPANAQLRQINCELAERLDDAPYKPISRYWGSAENFVEKSFGYCLLIDGSIASSCYAGGISSQYANFNVATAEPFRRQGLAMLVCSAAIEDCLRRKLLPTWDTDGENTASAALAFKLGFEEHKPFSQLSPEWGKSLQLSRGLWTKLPNGKEWVRNA